MNNLKRFFYLFLAVALVASSFFPITAYCNDNLENSGTGLIAFAYDTINNITGMSYSQPEDRLNDYLSTSAEALGWKTVQFLTDQISKSPVNYLANRLFDIDVSNPVGDFAAEKYHAAVLNRDYIDSIYECANKVMRTGVINSLQYYGITTQAQINYDENIVAHPPFYNPTNRPTGYLDITKATTYNGVSVLSAVGIAPVMFVPHGVQVYLYDRLLDTNCIYVLISNNYLFQCYCNGRTSVFLYTYDNGSGKSFEVASGFYNGYNGDYVEFTDLVNNNVLICTNEELTSVPQYTDETLSYIAQYEAHIGDTVFEDYPAVNPPVNIPYDNDGNIVICVPAGRTYSPTEIVYYSPETVKNYIDNGDIITSNYTTNLDENTYNKVVNNYYDYINNLDSDSSFDDINILSKLDKVIEWLRKIYNKITFEDVRTNPEYSGIFTDTPNYEKFSDCIFNNVPIITEISDAVKSGFTEKVDTGFEAPLYIAPEKAGIIEKSFDRFKINMSWYSPYRKQIYDILTAIIYGLGVVTCIRSVKSVFGLKGGGED